MVRRSIVVQRTGPKKPSSRKPSRQMLIKMRQQKIKKRNLEELLLARKKAESAVRKYKTKRKQYKRMKTK